LIALAVLPCSFLPYYGYEARPYGIYFMLAALALWVWTYNGKGKWLPAIFFGTTFLLGATIHYYFGLCLVPYALWEATRWRPWKPPSAKLIAGTVGAIVPVAIFSPLIVAFSNQFRQTFWGHPSVWLLGKVFSDVFPSGLVLLALVMVWVTLVGAEDKTIASPPMQPGEAVGWLFLCIPLAGFVVAYKTNAFADRYLIGTLPGIAVAFACWIWRGFRNASLVSAAIFLLLTTWGLANQLKIVEHPEVVDRAGQQTVTRRNLTLEGRLLGDGKRFILFSDAMVYLEAQYYFQHPEGCALILAPREEDPDYDSGRLVLNLARYYPLHIWALEDLTKHARETALIAPPPSTLNALDQAGFKAEVRFSEPFRVVYMH